MQEKRNSHYSNTQTKYVYEQETQYSELTL